MRLGRSPSDFDDYIRASNQQILDLEAEYASISMSSDPQFKKYKQRLRNKISALLSRMKAKKVELEGKTSVSQQKNKIDSVIAIIQKELTKGPQARKFYDKIQARLDLLIGKDSEKAPKKRRVLKT